MTHKILIVDDNEPTCKLLAATLSNAGYESLIALDGDQALKFAKENKIMCALIDQYMEPMDGFMLARHFTLNDIKIPMIMITANNTADLLTRAREVGFVSTMLKPVDQEHMLKMVKRFDRG
jgi:CheY-like chemotaxis protein